MPRCTQSSESLVCSMGMLRYQGSSSRLMEWNCLVNPGSSAERSILNLCSMLYDPHWFHIVLTLV